MGPTSFRYPPANHRRMRLLYPSDAVAKAFIDGLDEGDPVAERFVAETYHGELGARKARHLVEEAQRVGIDNMQDAPDSMRALFAEFEQIPEWVDTELVEEGAAVWRRWAYALGALGAPTTPTPRAGSRCRCRCPAGMPADVRYTGTSKRRGGGSRSADPARS